MAQYLEVVIASALSSFKGKDSIGRQQKLANAIIEVISKELGEQFSDRLSLASPLNRLLAIHRETVSKKAVRPDTPLSRSALLTGTRLDPSLALQLEKEIETADRVDILCSFIRWSGLRLLLPSLRRLTASASADGPRLRVITTSYMGATDPEAVKAIRDLPNTEVRVSYDTARTRLHAKAYLIHRATGFGSAYVGSANLTKAALSEGLEWTNKLSQYELPHLWQRVTATFEAYFNDPEFEHFTNGDEARLVQAISRERGVSHATGDSLVQFELYPFAFQEEILDILAAEREVSRKKSHLVVAATGTGKTMIAAFDYRQWCRDQRPPLLFVAHREELLKQALFSFRAVLKDQNFGHVVAAGAGDPNGDHVFCSIQSYNSREMWRLAADRYKYVVVDEFHHAAAPSYRRLLDHVTPEVLLGMTATPERADGLDILKWFGGEASAEIRLPDAISRRLLCPFQYFGITDCIDLDSLRWTRGGYNTSDLERVYTRDDVRAALVLQKIREIVCAPVRMRGLGFCVSVAHAEFMSQFFNAHGLSSMALSAQSTDGDRKSAQEKLRRREINMLFVVDLYNEGVDIPEVDTVVFLRPTESLTVFLQQFGRGLRIHDGKECLTVLDFIGSHKREFRFAQRFRALGTNPATRVDQEIEAGFPHLPSGCSIQLERVAQEHILKNVRESISLRTNRVVRDLKVLAGSLGRAPTLSEGVAFLDTSIEDLFHHGLWSRLLHKAGLHAPFDEAEEDAIAKGVRRIAHIDDHRFAAFVLGFVQSDRKVADLDEIERRQLTMFYVSLWQADGIRFTLEQADLHLRANPVGLRDLVEVLRYRAKHVHNRSVGVVRPGIEALTLHSSYTGNEILAALGHWSFESRPSFREGVLHLPDLKLDAFFITLDKTAGTYSPTTMYEDYAISSTLFHWQSQSTTPQDSPTGRRYVQHREMGYTPLLFVRENKRLPCGLSAPYSFLGAAEYVSHVGSRPMSIVWKLLSPMPARLIRTSARQVVG